MAARPHLARVATPPCLALRAHAAVSRLSAPPRLVLRHGRLSRTFPTAEAAARAYDDASLTRLELVSAPTTALAYNLSLTLTMRNPNWAMSITNTEPLVAAYGFDGPQFDRIRLADNGDKHPAGKTRVYRLTSGFENAYITLGNAGEAKFRKQNATGTFQVEVPLTVENDAEASEEASAARSCSGALSDFLWQGMSASDDGAARPIDLDDIEPAATEDLLFGPFVFGEQLSFFKGPTRWRRHATP